MANKFEVGQVVTGKVTGIQPYGLFIALNKELQGLVHISEITNGYVSNIYDHISIGKEVKVKIISMDGPQKISLSIKATENNQEKASNPFSTESENQQIGFDSLKEKLPQWLKQASKELK